MRIETEKRLVIIGVIGVAIVGGATGLSYFDPRLVVILILATVLILWRLLVISHRIRRKSRQDGHLPTMDSGESAEDWTEP